MTRFFIPTFLIIGCLCASAATGQTVSLVDSPVYKSTCAKCHGKTAEGRHFGGPSLVTSGVSSASAADLHGIIANGKGRMPKYSSKLSPADIETLVKQIQSTNKK